MIMSSGDIESGPHTAQIGLELATHILGLQGLCHCIKSDMVLGTESRVSCMLDKYSYQ